MLPLCPLRSQNNHLNKSICRDDQENKKLGWFLFIPLSNEARFSKKSNKFLIFISYLFSVCWSPLLLFVNPFEKDDGTNHLASCNDTFFRNTILFFDWFWLWCVVLVDFIAVQYDICYRVPCTVYCVLCTVYCALCRLWYCILRKE